MYMNTDFLSAVISILEEVPHSPNCVSVTFSGMSRCCDCNRQEVLAQRIADALTRATSMCAETFGCDLKLMGDECICSGEILKALRGEQ